MLALPYKPLQCSLVAALRALRPTWAMLRSCTLPSHHRLCRLTGGTLGFMALSSLVVLFVLYRTVPHKGKLLAGAAVFGSSFLATVLLGHPDGGDHRSASLDRTVPRSSRLHFGGFSARSA